MGLYCDYCGDRLDEDNFESNCSNSTCRNAANELQRQRIINDRNDIVLVPKDKFDKYNKLKASHDKLVEALMGSKPYSLLSCLTILTEAAKHLLNDHNCDAHGYEEIEHARDSAKGNIDKIKQALKEAEEL